LVDAFSDVNVDGAQGVSQWRWRGRVVCGEKRAQESVVQLGVEDRESQPVVGEAVLWRAVPAQDVGACLAGLPLYMLLPAVQRLKITGDCPLEQRLRLSR
jgi:hypothetical protein